MTTTEGRLGQAAVIVGQINRRLSSVEERLSPGKAITEEQAAEEQAAVLDYLNEWREKVVR